MKISHQPSMYSPDFEYGCMELQTSLYTDCRQGNSARMFAKHTRATPIYPSQHGFKLLMQIYEHDSSKDTLNSKSNKIMTNIREN